MKETKTVFTTIVGKPNVGKSTLLNNIVGEKIAIVTPKPQTTRTRITGILNRDLNQLVFIDTPGIHMAKNRLGEYMVKQSVSSISDVDLVVLVVEAEKKLKAEEIDLIYTIKKSNLPSILVINKVDKVKSKESILEKIDEISKIHEFNTYIPLSALNGDGVDILIDEVEKYAENSPHFFESGMVTDQLEQVIVSEIIREKMLFNLREEIPYGVGVVIEEMKERKRKNETILDINATIYCERDTHKGIIIGKGGGLLKKIASQSREDLEKFFGVKVNLQVWIKVKENWRNQVGVLRILGYDNS